jgi:hypothetical protein
LISDVYLHFQIKFETGPKLQRIKRIKISAFLLCRLQNIIIPVCIEVLCKSWFLEGRSLKLLTFETGSKLQRIEESAFSWSELHNIIIPAGLHVPPVTVYSFEELLNLSSLSRKRTSFLTLREIA